MKKFQSANRTLWFCLAGCTWALAARAELISYSYDPAGRVTGANYESGLSATHQYDAVGNLTRSTASAPAADTDNDGMSDAWELQHFGTLARDGTDDFDSDGMSDRAEFLAGTHPRLNTSVLRIIRLTPAFGLGATLEWTSVPGKQYRVQYKTSLAAPTWFDLPGEVAATGYLTTALDDTLAGIGSRFYRIAIATPGPPMLLAARANNQFIVSWSSLASGFSLETTTNLAAPAGWLEVTNPATDNGTLKTVSFDLNPLEPQRFFRLQQ